MNQQQRKTNPIASIRPRIVHNSLRVAAKEVTEKYTDQLDQFLWHATRWHEAILLSRPNRETRCPREPFQARAYTLLQLESEMLATSDEISIATKAGLTTPLLMMWRKLHETQVNASLIASDLTGQIGHQYFHANARTLAKLYPEDQGLQRVKEASLRDLKFDNLELGQTWTTLPETGKPLASLESRNRYVRTWERERAKNSEGSRLP